jgi:hypothetical protein
MPRPRKYPSNAARQAAYRRRLKRGEVVSQGASTAGTRHLVARVMAADAKERE